MKVMPDDHDMLAEYDFCKGIRGKYTARYSEGINVIDTAFDEGKAEGMRVSKRARLRFPGGWWRVG